MQLFTIGYEGRSIDHYIALLKQHQIDLLCDVRKDPVSRKPGFSKKAMEQALSENGIRYHHYPELGVPKPVRDKVQKSNDYRWLSQWYKEEVLKDHPAVLGQLYQQLKKIQRIALTCYEADVKHCHRLFIVQTMLDKWPNRFGVKHI